MRHGAEHQEHVARRRSRPAGAAVAPAHPREVPVAADRDDLGARVQGDVRSCLRCAESGTATWSRPEPAPRTSMWTCARVLRRNTAAWPGRVAAADDDDLLVRRRAAPPWRRGVVDAGAFEAAEVRRRRACGTRAGGDDDRPRPARARRPSSATRRARGSQSSARASRDRDSRAEFLGLRLARAGERLARRCRSESRDSSRSSRCSRPARRAPRPRSTRCRAPPTPRRPPPRARPARRRPRPRRTPPRARSPRSARGTSASRRFDGLRSTACPGRPHRQIVEAQPKAVEEPAARPASTSMSSIRYRIVVAGQEALHPQRVAARIPDRPGPRRPGRAGSARRGAG